LIPNGTTAPQLDLTKIDTIRAAWVPYFTAATGGRGAVDTTLSTSNDNTPPDITITAGPTGTITGNSVIFTWAGTDNLTSTANLLYAFRLDPLETSFSPVGSATSKTYTGLADGTYTFFVKARDQAGNEALMPASRTFTVDTTPPDTALTAGPTGTIRGNSVTFTWTGTDTLTPTASLLYAFRLDPLERTFSPLGSATSKTYTGLANGSYTFFVKAMDQAGNEDPTPASRGFSVAVPNLSCAIQMSQAIYVNGDTVTASVLRLTALDAAPVPVELKLWFDVPGMAPLSFVNVGAQGDIQLPAGFDQNFGPLPLAPVTPELPPGSYAFNCRIFDPVTGQLLSEDLNPFAIDPPSSNLPVPGDMATSVPGPACEIQLSQSSYANGDTLTAATLRIVNPSSTPLPIELKLWFEVPGLAPISFISLGGMGDVQLPVGFDQNFGPLPLATVTPAFPRGAYAFNCRIFDPVTGQLLSEDLNAFVIP
ncbi:MAG: hypothetical protein HYZ81_16250, partial [Nitrospinae bacterium]|nr:hypothetical protein [Nitrospinota bacterium]